MTGSDRFTAATTLDDYDVVRSALKFITEHWRTQPEVEAIAHAAGVTPDELHHLFRRWAGLTPMAFLQALNGVRLVLGTMLDITEDHDIGAVDENDPLVNEYNLYDFLSWILDWAVRAVQI